MKEFKIPQISTLAGSTILNYLKILGKNKVEPKYYLKVFLTTLIVLIATPFHWWESLVFKWKLSKFEFENPPLFIIGHWRSGTTLVHNMLCKDPSASYLTTYHSLFPNNLLSKWIFKTFMRINMPNKRPSDNMELNINFPQEDEFAFSNCQANAYYNFFYFPGKYKTYYDRAIHHKNLKKKEIDIWYKSYDKLLRKAAINSGGKQLLIKNPVNTARIDKILKLYPNAKFLYIYRNPISVFFSTQRFFQKLFPSLWLHKVDQTFIDTIILETYMKLMHGYQEQKSMIPAGNLMELKFEEFEKNPLAETEKIYSVLLKEDFEVAKPYFISYYDSIKDYKKNRYTINEFEINVVREKWKYFMNLYNYTIPEDIEMNIEK